MTSEISIPRIITTTASKAHSSSSFASYGTGGQQTSGNTPVVMGLEDIRIEATTIKSPNSILLQVSYNISR
jgi:hypothetical protein